MTELNEALVESARLGSGIDTVYRALDRLVALYALADAAVVVDVPPFGRQLLHAGRRPLGDDEHGLHDAAPGLYLYPEQTEHPEAGELPHGAAPPHAAALADLMVALGTLGLRHDARGDLLAPSPPSLPSEPARP